MNHKTALIGCGGRGRQHLLALLADPRLEVVALADAKREAAEALAEGRPVYTGYREMLERERPEVVVVALWTDLHLPALRDCAAAGVRAVLCEKPMARTWGQTREIAALAESSGMRLTFCHQRRFAEGNRQVRSLLDEGWFGKVERMDLFSPPHLLDCGTHSVDQALSFHRETPVKWAHGAVDLSTTVSYFNVPAEGASCGTFAFEDGVVATLRTAGPDLDYWSGVRVVGSEGFVEVLWDGQVQRARVYGDPDWRLEPVETPHEAQMVGYVRDAVDALETGREPETSWRHGLRAAEVLFALYESARRRARVDLPLSEDVDDPLGDMLRAR